MTEENKMPDKIAVSNGQHGLFILRGTEVTMGMCYYIRSDKHQALQNLCDRLAMQLKGVVGYLEQNGEDESDGYRDSKSVIEEYIAFSKIK